jgi:hypothetical protein
MPEPLCVCGHQADNHTDAASGDLAPLRQDLAKIMSPTTKGGRDPRAASFPASAAYATRGAATQAQPHRAPRAGREPGIER